MNKAFKLVIVHVFILLLVTFSGCTKNEKNYTIKEVNGIKTFKNKNVNSVENLVIEPKEVFSITSADSTIQDSSRTIYGFGVYEVDSSGNIFIMDQMKNEVRKFDKNGKYNRGSLQGPHNRPRTDSDPACRPRQVHQSACEARRVRANLSPRKRSGGHGMVEGERLHGVSLTTGVGKLKAASENRAG